MVHLYSVPKRNLLPFPHVFEHNTPRPHGKYGLWKHECRFFERWELRLVETITLFLDLLALIYLPYLSNERILRIKHASCQVQMENLLLSLLIIYCFLDGNIYQIID